MNIEILSIGNELLSGRTINTNASFIAKELRKIGAAVHRVTIVPDKVQVLREELRAAMKRSSIIIMTGGLGPTQDDITRAAFSEEFAIPLVYNKGVAKDLEQRFGKKLPTLQDQVMVLEGAEVIFNSFGTAPGFIFSHEESVFIVLPGVPSQMEEMVQKTVLPYLAKKIEKKKIERSLFFCSIQEHEMEPLLCKLKKENPEVDIGICPAFDTLSLFLSTFAKDETEAEQKLSPLIHEVRFAFSDCLFSTKSSQIEQALLESLQHKKKTLALAESCTGGAIASRLVAIEGASSVFLGSIVSYANEVKESLLHVSPLTLQEKGVVSRETVLEMLEGVFTCIPADYAMAVSGIAGPSGGSFQKPVGTVWVAIGERGKEKFAKKLYLERRGRRDLVIEDTTVYLLSTLWRWIEKGVLPFQK